MKKILAFVLILSILAVVPCALAANKSKTTGGGGSDYEWKPIPSGPDTVNSTEDLSEAATEMITAMEEAVQGGGSASSVLEPDAASELGDEAVATDAVGIKADGTKPADGVFSFPTKYDVNAKLKALITCFDANKTVTAQFVAKATPLEDGRVKVHFTKKMLQAMQTASSTSIVIFEMK